MKQVQHPGPVRASRMDLIPCAGCDMEVTLSAGMSLEEAVAQALAPLELDSAWLEFTDADISALAYVIPAEAPDEMHVAWYSDVHCFEAGRIDQLGMIVGRHEGTSFLHGHGTWTPAGGSQAMGHILARQTRLALPVIARGIGLTGARFDRRADAETQFDLFHVDRVGPECLDYVDWVRPEGSDYAALRLLPNQDFANSLEAACSALGWTSARVHGIGSINTARFEDGRMLDSLPTEFLVTDAIAGIGGPGPEIVIVGTDGTHILSGRLSRGENPVLVTAEVVLNRKGV